MKYLKNILAVTLLLFSGSIIAQKINKQIINETETAKLSVETDKGTFDYTVKINSKAFEYVTTKNSSKKEQSRKQIPYKVNTIIKVNNDKEPFYDNIITLSYKSNTDDSVEIIPTNKGFNILIDGEKIAYDFFNKKYMLPKNSTISINKMKGK